MTNRRSLRTQAGALLVAVLMSGMAVESAYAQVDGKGVRMIFEFASEASAEGERDAMRLVRIGRRETHPEKFLASFPALRQTA